MQPYMMPTRASSAIDKIFLRLVILALSFAWFYLLWGKVPQSLTAGAALSLLFFQVIKYGERRSRMKHAAKLRVMVGGEREIDALMYESEPNAALRCGNLLYNINNSKNDITSATRETERGVLITVDGMETLVKCVLRHSSSSLTHDDILCAVRESREVGAAECVVCATCKAAATLEAYAAEMSPRVRIVQRAELVRLAGKANPATDEEVAERYRMKRGGRIDFRAVAARAINPRKAKRYGIYGLVMCAMLMVTRRWIYAIPTVVCLVLFYLSRAREG